MILYLQYFFFFLFQGCFIVQLYYLLVIQKKIDAYKPINVDFSAINFPVSVIICARNEAKNLKEFLPFVLNQNYPDFEVVVVNDCSFDNSEDILRIFQGKYPNLKVVKISEHPRFKTSKKFALALGIKAAKNEILILTDADCKPYSENWVALMASNYANPATEIVLGYSPYVSKKGFLNKLISYETFQTAINYCSFTLNGMPYMGVGRNLSYKKSLFFKGKGFAAHMQIPSGDDDLFVNQHANAKNTEIELRPESHVWSEPKLTWASYWNQKIRHTGAGKFYKKSHRISLTLQAMSAILFFVLFVVCLGIGLQWQVLCGIFVARLLAQIYTYFKSMELLGVKRLRWLIILLDPFYYFYLSLLVFVCFFKKKITWK